MAQRSDAQKAFWSVCHGALLLLVMMPLTLTLAPGLWLIERLQPLERWLLEKQWEE